MESKPNYNPQEVTQMLRAYAALVSYDHQIGGGKRLGMSSQTIKGIKEGLIKAREAIPKNVEEGLEKKVDGLINSISNTLDRSED